MANTDLVLRIPGQLNANVRVQSGLTAWSYGDWMVLDSSVPNTINIIGFSFSWAYIPAVDTTIQCIFDISVAPRGQRAVKIQLPYSLRSDTAVGIYNVKSNLVYLPEGFVVPADSEIAVRVADSIVGNLGYNCVSLLVQTTTAVNVSPGNVFSNNYQRLKGNNGLMGVM